MKTATVQTARQTVPPVVASLAIPDANRQYALRKDIRPDPKQPRKTFRPEAMEELRESIRANGITDDLIVRKDPEGKAKWMLIEGERRWRVAGELDIERLPIVVREWDEASVRKYQRIVGTQRENLTALETASAFGREFDAARAGNAELSLADFAAAQGIPRAVAYETMALLKVSAPVKAALEKGEIDASKARLFATVPAELHKKLLKEVEGDQWDGPMSTRDLKEHIEEEYSRQLNKAPWKLDDAELVKACGSCSACPKRSGNIEGFGGNANVCTDVKCFAAKQEAHCAVMLKKAEAEGQRTISTEAYEHGKYSQYSEADTKCYEAEAKGQTLKTLAKKADIKPIIAVTRAGEAVEVFNREDVAAIKKAAGIKESSYSGGSRGPSKAERARQQLAAKVNDATVAEIVAAVEGKPLTLAAWQLLAGALISTAWSDAVHEVIKRRKLELGGDRYTHGDKFAKLAGEMTEAQCRGVVFEFLVCRGLRGFYGVEKYTRQALTMFKVDKKKIEQRIKTEAAEKKKKPAAKSKPAKKGAKKKK